MQKKYTMIHLNLLNNQELIPQFRKLLDKIAASNEPLALNYSRDRFKFDNFLSIDLVVDQDIIKAFSCLQFGRWGKHIGRISSRLWVDPNFRNASTPSNFNSKLLMPAQIQTAKEAKLKGVFWSTSRANNIKTFQKMIQRNNENCTCGYTHVPLEGQYNVCGSTSSDSGCIQKVAVIYLEKDFYFTELINYKVS